MKRDVAKVIELSGRRWQIGRFDACTGSYMLTVLLRLVGPMLSTILPEDLDTPMEEIKEHFNPALLLSLLPRIDKYELQGLQQECLRVCRELKDGPSGAVPMPLIMDDGRWAVEDLEYDTMTVLMLTVHTLIFNVTGFFAESASKGLIDSFQGLNLFGART